ncbi:MAG: sigma-70 family RNA polymerase sigma factor [Alphaproteobacteria bacterium]|nr:sigma-70 family RNA polymerase sigma factor [Alphaproteobacteria bacterium]
MAPNKSKFESEVDRVFIERRNGLRAIACRAGKQDAEDVVQDAFLKLVETSQRQEIRKLDRLLSRIVRLTAIDRLRRRMSRPVVISVDAGEGPLDPAADPERSLMGAQRLDRVMATIDAMPPRRREVFLLHRVDELTYHEIARRLGVSVKAVEKHMGLAMKQLSDADD